MPKDAQGREYYDFPSGTINYADVKHYNAAEYLSRHFSRDHGEINDYTRANNAAALANLEAAKVIGQVQHRTGHIRSMYTQPDPTTGEAVRLHIETSFDTNRTAIWRDPEPRPADLLDAPDDPKKPKPAPAPVTVTADPAPAPAEPAPVVSSASRADTYREFLGG